MGEHTTTILGRGCKVRCHMGGVWKSPMGEGATGGGYLIGRERSL
jgi:hypothetical protein